MSLPEQSDGERLRATEKERDRLRASLERFGRHVDGCPAVLFGDRCLCGFHAALVFHCVSED